ncbi:hypothetical protein LTS18_007343, partial [Coniosporium uncinatum]
AIRAIYHACGIFGDFRAYVWQELVYLLHGTYDPENTVFEWGRFRAEAQDLVPLLDPDAGWPAWADKGPIPMEPARTVSVEVPPPVPTGYQGTIMSRAPAESSGARRLSRPTSRPLEKKKSFFKLVKEKATSAFSKKDK